MAASSTPKEIHITLLTDISNDMVVGSPEYNNFIEHMKTYVPRGILGSRQTLLGKLEALANVGCLGIARYDELKRIAENSRNIEVKTLIEEAERKLAKIVPEQVPDSKESHSPVAKQHMPDPEQVPGSKEPPSPIAKTRRHAEDEPNPLHYASAIRLGIYNTTGKQGFLLILNSKENRPGTEQDVKNLTNFFCGKLNFSVVDPREQQRDDLTSEQLRTCLTDVRTYLNSIVGQQFYCFVCAILCRGTASGITTTDGVITTEEIRKGFNNMNMPKFAGRPKLFFIQACLGSKVQGSVAVTKIDESTASGSQVSSKLDEDAVIVHIPDNSDSRMALTKAPGQPKPFFIQACVDDHVRDSVAASTIKDPTSSRNQAGRKLDEDDVLLHIPDDADTLMAFSTTSGYVSFRRIGVGSWFFAETLRVFDEQWRYLHVEDMMITVRENVALEWSGNNNAKQMPCVWSTLTKRLFFQRYNK